MSRGLVSKRNLALTKHHQLCPSLVFPSILRLCISSQSLHNCLFSWPLSPLTPPRRLWWWTVSVCFPFSWNKGSSTAKTCHRLFFNPKPGVVRGNLLSLTGSSRVTGNRHRLFLETANNHNYLDHAPTNLTPQESPRACPALTSRHSPIDLDTFLHLSWESLDLCVILAAVVRSGHHSYSYSFSTVGKGRAPTTPKCRSRSASLPEPELVTEIWTGASY